MRGVEEDKEKRTDKVGLVLSECHVEGRWKFSSSKTERHLRILHPATVDSFTITHTKHQILLVSLTVHNPWKQMNYYLNKTFDLLITRIPNRGINKKGPCIICGP